MKTEDLSNSLRIEQNSGKSVEDIVDFICGQSLVVLSFYNFSSIAFTEIVVCILPPPLLCCQELDGVCEVLPLIAHKLIQLHFLIEQVKGLNEIISSLTDFQQGLFEFCSRAVTGQCLDNGPLIFKNKFESSQDQRVE